MKILIVEDEIIARKKLENLLLSVVPDVHLLAQLESVEDTVAWFKQHPAPDIAFFDVQLSDATCFEIFERVQVSCPVIFLTAYDAYVMKAFEHNAIHYLLKPVNGAKIQEALQKVQQFKAHFIHMGIQNILTNDFSGNNYPSRLVVKKGMDDVPLNISQIAYFFSAHKITFAKTFDDTNYMVDEALIDLEKRLDPTMFFRVNRQYLVHINAVQHFRSTPAGKVKIEVKPHSESGILASKENAGRFRKWVKGT